MNTLCHFLCYCLMCVACHNRNVACSFTIHSVSLDDRHVCSHYVVIIILVTVQLGRSVCRLVCAFSYYGIVLLTTALFENPDGCHGSSPRPSFNGTTDTSRVLLSAVPLYCSITVIVFLLSWLACITYEHVYVIFAVSLSSLYSPAGRIYIYMNWN